MIINILAGGPIQHIPDLTKYSSDDSIWVGVDRGVYELLLRKIIPSKAFGDFDSVVEEEFSLLKEKMKDISFYPSEKDETDLELALTWAFHEKCRRIRLFGATGGRLDHFLGNIQLLLRGLNEDTEIEMIDIQNKVVVKRPGSHKIEQNPQYPYVSFLPFSESVRNLTLEGFKYPLKNRHIHLGSTLCISNELIEKIGTFSFTDGILIMVRSHD